MKKYKQGDKHPIIKNLVFHSYNKRISSGEYWVTEEKMKSIRGYDDFWSVYYLPKANYCGSTKRLKRRINEHKKLGKNVDGFIVVGTFDNKKDACEFEQIYQNEHNALGYIFTEENRRMKSACCKRDRTSDVLRKKVRCISTGVIYDSIRECARVFKSDNANLVKHLKGINETFMKLKFERYEG